MIKDSDNVIDAYKQLFYVWKPKLSIRPRRCQLSGDRIPMFTFAYKGVRKTFISERNWKFYAWASKERYLFEKIKGTVN